NWANTRAEFGIPGAGSTGNSRYVFRGLGYGPAEIGLPAVSASGSLDPAYIPVLHAIITDRYSSDYDVVSTPPPNPMLIDVKVPGRPGADSLDVLRTGARPAWMTASGGYGYSVDPFGRGGVAMGRSGHLVAAVSGRQIATGASPPLD